MEAPIRSAQSIFRSVCLVGLAGLPQRAQAREPLEVLLVEKAPYYYPGADNPHGFLYDRFACMMQAAKIPMSYHFQPINRVLHHIKIDPKACSLGWFRIPLREGFASFSQGIWDDQPMVVVVHKDAVARFAAMGSLEALMKTRGLRAVIPENVSYGQNLDRVMSRSQHSIQSSTINFVQSLTMVANKRVDYTIANIPEFTWHKKLEKERNGRDVIEIIRYSDMPEGEPRHLMCHRDFRRQDMEAINQAIYQHRKDCDLKLAPPE